MKITTCYAVKVKHYNHIFDATIKLYRSAVDFFIEVCLAEWNTVSAISGLQKQQSYIEQLVHTTKANPASKYDFDRVFYKFQHELSRY